MKSIKKQKEVTMAEGVKGGLTLPWLWIAFIIAYLSLGFMLPPLDKPLKKLAETKMIMEEKEVPEKEEIVF